MYVIYILVVGADNCHFWITLGLILITHILVVKAHELNYVVKSYFDQTCSHHIKIPNAKHRESSRLNMECGYLG